MAEVKLATTIAPNQRSYAVRVVTPILHQESSPSPDVNNVFMYLPHESSDIKKAFDEQGFVVIADQVSTFANRQALKKTMLAVSGVPNALKAGFLELSTDDTLAQLRQDTMMYKVFANLFGTDNLWSVFDRTIYHSGTGEPELMNPHVDQSPIAHPGFGGVQGMLAIEAMNETTGTLAVIPTSHAWFGTYAHWAKGTEQFIENQSPKLPPFTALCVPAGALIIWDSRLTHSRYWGTMDPLSRNPRFAALITYMPAPDPLDPKTKDLVAARRDCFLSGISKNNHEAGLRATASPRCEVSLRQTPERLTPLGVRLYGIRSW